MINRLKLLKQNRGFIKYFSNTSWLFGERILRMAVGLFVGIWVARYLGPEEFGLFSYASAFVGIFATVATLGLDEIVIRELVKDESKRDLLLGTAFVLKIIGAFVVLSLVALVTDLTSDDLFTNKLIFIIAASTLFQSFNVIDFYFQANVLSKYIVYANTTVMFIFSIIRVILILDEAPLIEFVWVALFNSILLSIAYIYIYLHRDLSLKSWKFETEVAVYLLKNSWPLIVSSIVISIYMRVDQVMIKEMLDNDAVGQYAAAVRLSEAWYFLPMVISSSLFPAIINAKEKSQELYTLRIITLLNILYCIAIPLVIIVYMYAKEIILFLYGENYLFASPVLSIHIIAFIFVSLGVGMHKWIIIENLQKYEFYSLLFGSISNIILNYFLIGRYGIVGAAIATLLSQIIANIFLLLIIHRTRYIALAQLRTIFLLNIKYF